MILVLGEDRLEVEIEVVVDTHQILIDSHLSEKRDDDQEVGIEAEILIEIEVDAVEIGLIGAIETDDVMNRDLVDRDHNPKQRKQGNLPH